MFIIWGTKRTVRKQGIVADFCPICREVRPFEIKRIGKLNQIYYIAFGEGTLLGYIRECQVCGTTYNAEPLDYAKLEKDRSRVNDLEGLVRDTYPNLGQEYDERLGLEQLLKKSPSSVPPDIRMAHVVEIFRLINPEVELYYTRDTRMDKKSGLGCLGTLLLGGGLITLAITKFEHSKLEDPLMYAAMGVFAIGTIYTIVMLALGPGRFVKKKLLPKMARGLHPLAPTEGEITAVLEKCKSLGMKVGKKVKTAQIMEALRAYRPDGGM